MADLVKRKAPDHRDGGSKKKKKRGNSGKWKVPKSNGFERTKASALEAGDVGIWVTCALHMKGKAAREMELLFDHYADKFYGIKSGEAESDVDADGSDDDQGKGDIESAIQKEIGNLKNKHRPSSDRLFTEVRINQECLLFCKCKPPVDPVDFCRRICQDATNPDPTTLKARYLNRLTPVSVMSNATESGLEKGARQALSFHFNLKSKPTTAVVQSGVPESQPEAKGPPDSNVHPATFAIRPSIRNHSTLNRDIVIKNIAHLVHPRHNVNLGAPDKVVLVEIYQTVCGISVVPGDWEALKRYNLTELYKQASLLAQDSETKKEAHVMEPFEKPETMAET